MADLDKDNPECLIWKHGQVQVSILGGVRIDGLDRMKVTVKVACGKQVIRHNLDLYNDEALGRLVRKRSEKFSKGSGYMGDLFTAENNMKIGLYNW
jgi:hypothetical protein